MDKLFTEHPYRIKEAKIKDLLQLYDTEEITFSRFVELINEEAKKIVDRYE